MSIHPDCEKKILEFGGNDSIRQGILDLVKAVANDAINTESPSGTFVMCMYDEGSNLQPGDWAAELHIVARQVGSTDETETTDGDQQTTDDPEPTQEATA